jgi:hypothetical protein
MSSATDEMAALRSKIVELELKHRIHRMARKTELMEIKMQAALEKKDLEQKMEKKDLEQKMEKKDLEQKMELMEIKMQAALEKNEQKMDKKDLEQKMELAKMQASLENEKRDREADKRETQHQIEIENEKRDRLLENEKRDREVDKKETQHQIENEKRDREADKKETQHQIENEKRDRLLENEKRDREADKRKTQLQWEARFAQLEQQLHTMQPLTNPVENAARLNLAQQRANEELMLERLQLCQSERREKETGSLHPIASATAMQAATQHSTAASALLLPSAAGLSAPIGSTNALAARPLSTRPVEAGVLQQEQRQPAAGPSASNAPSRVVRQQPRQQVTTGPEPARTAAVALPSDARMHFFLSHCQGTGGDQTNAIYLELRQLGFACWYSALFCDLFFCTLHISLTPFFHLRYDNRATDLTKDGMKHGIEGAAAFLLFLSEGVLDRPFCECVSPNLFLCVLLISSSTSSSSCSCSCSCCCSSSSSSSSCCCCSSSSSSSPPASSSSSV